MTKLVYYRNEHMKLLAEAERSRKKMKTARTLARLVLYEDAKKHIQRAYLLRCKLRPSNPALAFAA